MLLLLATDNLRATAVALEAKAFDYINPIADPGPPVVRTYPGTTSWSPIYTDNASPTPRFGIVYDHSIQSAFTDAELGAVRSEEGELLATENVVEGEQYTVPRPPRAPFGEWHVSPS
jgi:hypothetical protein